MKTIHEIYKDLISSEGGLAKLDEIKRYAITCVSHACDSPGLVPKTFDRIISLLEKNAFPKSGYVIVTYTGTSYFGIGQCVVDELMMPVFRTDRLVKEFRRLDEWDKVVPDPNIELGEGEVYFHNLGKANVEKLIMFKHALFPYTMLVDKQGIDQLLGSYVYLDGYREEFFLEELFRDVLYVLCCDMAIDDRPELLLAQLPDTVDDELVNKTFLLSYLNLYDSMKKARKQLCRAEGIDRIILRNSAQCKKCGQYLVSSHTHDAQTCSCSSLTVDGGQDYLRRVGNREDYIDTSIIEYIKEEEK